MSDIFKLKLHESTIVVIDPKDPHGRAYPYVWQVTRVETGWIYQDANPNIQTPVALFVPTTLKT